MKSDASKTLTLSQTFYLFPTFVLYFSFRFISILSSFLCGWLVSLCCAAGWVCVSRFIRRPLLLYAAGTELQEPGDDRPLDANKLTVDVS